MTCPISHDFMQDPVKCSDGKTYDRAKIVKWFQGIRSGETDLGRKGEGQRIDSAGKLLDRMMTQDPGAHQACLIGPPASGKTVTMLQIVYAAVVKYRSKTPEGKWGLIPVFMRATELSALLSENRARGLKILLMEGNKKLESLRALVMLILAHHYQQGVVKIMEKLFDLHQLLICVYGLDEAAQHRELIERSIDQAVKVVKSGVPLRVLLSTREHSYVDSRKCLRLGEFGVVKLEPLNEIRQLDMVKRRMACPEKMDRFMQQLAKTKRRNPELSTSPLLLSLMVEVYKKHDAIPTQRVELYEQQVQGIVERSIQSRVRKSEIKELLVLATEFPSLETLAFVSQVQREERDFRLATCMTSVRVLWMRDVALLANIREVLFKDPVVGLLSKVGRQEYRFSHLTLQEYLAARCAVWLYGHNVEELVQQLMPLHSQWRREVFKFTACMLKEIFAEFCKTVLEHDNEAGAKCELVRAFLKERVTSVESDEVEQMVRDELLKLRGGENFIAGLCYPSLELCDDATTLKKSEGSDKTSKKATKVSAGTTMFARCCRVVMDVGRDVLRILFEASYQKEGNARWTESSGRAFLSTHFPDGPSQRRLGKHFIDNIHNG